MASWSEIENEVPKLAETARGIFDGHRHKILATLRKDGSPRVSGSEIEFRDGEIFFGSMRDAVKARDLQRDPRFALHAAPGKDEDAKLSGVVEEIEHPDHHLFRAEIEELVVTWVDREANQLVIESWHPGRGYERRVRS